MSLIAYLKNILCHQKNASHNGEKKLKLNFIVSPECCFVRDYIDPVVLQLNWPFTIYFDLKRFLQLFLEINLLYMRKRLNEFLGRKVTKYWNQVNVRYFFLGQALKQRLFSLLIIKANTIMHFSDHKRYKSVQLKINFTARFDHNLCSSKFCEESALREENFLVSLRDFPIDCKINFRLVQP